MTRSPSAHSAPHVRIAFKNFDHGWHRRLSVELHAVTEDYNLQSVTVAPEFRQDDDFFCPENEKTRSVIFLAENTRSLLGNDKKHFPSFVRGAGYPWRDAFLLACDTVMAIAGIEESLAPKELLFSYNGTTATIPFNKIRRESKGKQDCYHDAMSFAARQMRIDA